MKKNIFYSAVMLMVASAAFTACQSDEEIVNNCDNTPKAWTLSVSASKSADSQTRALAINGTSLTATWKTTEKVAVVSSDNATDYGDIAPVVDGANVKLTGTLTDAVSDFTTDTKLNLYFPASAMTASGVVFDYTGQTGSLEDLESSKYDYCEATNVAVNQIDAANKLIEMANASSTNQQAMCAFTFTDGTNGIAIKELTISSATANSLVQKTNVGGTNTYGDLTISANQTSAGPLYIAIHTDKTDAADKYYFHATANDGIRYEGYATAKLVDGKYYATDIKLKASLALGNYVFSDGTYGGLEFNPDKIPVAVIFSTSQSTTNTISGATADASNEAFGHHGYALALKDASTICIQWANSLNINETDIPDYGTSDWKTIFANKDGYTETSKIVSGGKLSGGYSKTNYPAFYQAKNYSGATAPAGTSGWYLPSAGQWYDILVNLGGLTKTPTVTSEPNNSLNIYWKNTSSNDLGTITLAKINAYMTAAVGTTNASDLKKDWYWSSSEYTEDNASMMNLEDEYQVGMYYYGKDGWNCRVRSVLAF